jgi:GNAT superfamily N-acetyltransferase
MDATHELTVEPITAEQTHPLRMSVLRPGRPEAECVFPGDEDPSTLHAGAVLDGDVVAIASLYLEPRPDGALGGATPRADHAANTAWRLRGMATAPAVRRRGAGAAALRACEAHARANGGTLLWCNARVEAVAFYEAEGWTKLGTEFDIPTVGPHFVMERPLG